MPNFDSIYAYVRFRLCLTSDSLMPMFFEENAGQKAHFSIKKLYPSKKGANFVRCNKKY